MTYSDELYGIWLSLRYPAGDPMIGRLLSRLRTASAVYRAEKELLYSLGFSSGEVRPLRAKDLSQAERIASLCASKGIAVIQYSDPGYPVQFMQLDAPPAVIYCRGKLPDTSSELLISAVGTRKMSDTGRLNAHRLCFDLAAAGAVVVSGMARGIDSVCHQGAIDGGGKTVAVLGCGADVTLLDVRMPGVDGIAALDEILSDIPDAKVIMLSTSDAEEDIFRAVTMGAKGYLLKESDPNRLLDAIRTVAAGGSCLPEELRRVYEARAAERGLTSRESEILRYIAKGYSNEEIADMVHLSLNTVKTHVKSILSNLNVSDRAEAVAEGIHRGIIA